MEGLSTFVSALCGSIVGASLISMCVVILFLHNHRIAGKLLDLLIVLMLVGIVGYFVGEFAL